MESSSIELIVASTPFAADAARILARDWCMETRISIRPLTQTALGRAKAERRILLADSPDPRFVEAARELEAELWSWLFDDPPRLGPPALAAHLKGRGSLPVRLVAWDPQQPARVRLLEEGLFATSPLSPAATCRRFRTAILRWPLRALERELAGRPSATLLPTPRPAAAPGLFARILWPIATLRNLPRRLLEQAREEVRTIGILDRPPASFLEQEEIECVRWLRARSEGGSWAHPFGVDRTPLSVIFAEARDAARDHGRIVALVRRADGDVRELAVELPVSGPQSFPFLVTHEGRLYMTPETPAERALHLFVCEAFPSRWRRVATLLEDFPAVAPVVYRGSDRWWLFATRRDDQEASDLYLFWADSLFGPWRPHRHNPVKSDLRSARPAGPLFMHRGALFRPAQDRTCGSATRLVLNRVEELSQSDFRETAVARLGPMRASPYGDGLHTLSPFGRHGALIDARRERYSLLRLVRRLRPWAR